MFLECSLECSLYLVFGPLRTRSRSVGGDRARPFLSDRSRHITLVYSLVIDHLILH